MKSTLVAAYEQTKARFETQEETNLTPAERFLKKLSNSLGELCEGIKNGNNLLRTDSFFRTEHDETDTLKQFVTVNCEDILLFDLKATEENSVTLSSLRNLSGTRYHEENYSVASAISCQNLEKDIGKNMAEFEQELLTMLQQKPAAAQHNTL